MGRTSVGIAITMVVGLLSGCVGERLYVAPPCAPDDEACAAECTEAESLAVFRHRIQPLLDDARPSSCNACHLTGIPLDAFVRETPCQSMSCLIDKDLVDFADVEQSRILQWIEQGQPHPEMVDAARAEYEGFRAWIAYSARCHAQVCDEMEQPCGPPLDGGPQIVDAGPGPVVDAAPTPDSTVADAALDGGPAPDGAPVADAAVAVDAAPDLAVAATPDAAPIPDDGPCGPETSTTIFVERVLSWKGRCNHCHTADGITAGVGGAPIWLIDEESRPAAQATMASIIERGYLDPDDPSQSLILLKPLHRGHGGVRHGGGNKFLSQDDPAYLDFRYWVERQVRCETGSPLDWGTPEPEDAGPSDAGPSDVGPGNGDAADAGPGADR